MILEKKPPSTVPRRTPRSFFLRRLRSFHHDTHKNELKHDREPEQSFVTFIVGDDESKKTFQVHKIIAVSKSPVFKAAFDGKFAEAESQSMRLDDIEVEDFGNVVHCLYLGKLKVCTLHSLRQTLKKLPSKITQALTES